MGRFRSEAEKEPLSRTYGTLYAICYIIPRAAEKTPDVVFLLFILGIEGMAKM